MIHFFLQTSIWLHERYEIGFQASDTIRADRTQKCPPINSKEMKHEKGGLGILFWYIDTDIILGRWNYSSAVETNFEHIEPMGVAEQYDKISREDVPSTDGVNLYDWLVSRYGINMKEGKQWYWTIFIWLLDVCIVV